MTKPTPLIRFQSNTITIKAIELFLEKQVQVNQWLLCDVYCQAIVGIGDDGYSGKRVSTSSMCDPLHIHIHFPPIMNAHTLTLMQLSRTFYVLFSAVAFDQENCPLPTTTESPNTIPGGKTPRAHACHTAYLRAFAVWIRAHYSPAARPHQSPQLPLLNAIEFARTFSKLHTDPNYRRQSW